MTKVLFVCLGNICRSPMAEAIFNAQCKEKGIHSYSADSAGTASYHIGSQPDQRTIDTLRRHSIPVNHRARQFSEQDYEDFDYIIAMDQNNYRDIIDTAGYKHQNLFLMREFDTSNSGEPNVPDPYYGGMDGFENIYGIISEACENLINHISKNTS